MAIHDQVLVALYLAWFQGAKRLQIGSLRDAGGWSEIEFGKAISQLEQSGQIKPYALGGFYLITSFGIIEAEKQGLPPLDLVKANTHARTKIMRILAEAYDSGGELASTTISDLATKTELQDTEVATHLDLVEDAHYAKATSLGSFKITSTGLRAVQEWRKKQAFEDEFILLAQMAPHARGRAFQKFFARLAEMHGWKQLEGVKTNNEEMDVVLFRDREFYLLECKWEKDPIQADVVRELFGKLGNRAGVRGMILSMSGFTSGAVDQVIAYIGQREVLLFGPKDVQNLVGFETAFDDALNTKFQHLVMRRGVLFE